MVSGWMMDGWMDGGRTMAEWMDDGWMMMGKWMTNGTIDNGCVDRWMMDGWRR